MSVLRRCLICVTLAVITVGLGAVDSGRPILQAVQEACSGTPLQSSDVLLCDDFEDGTFLVDWIIGSNRNMWPYAEFVLCGPGFGFGDHCAAWSNHLIFDGSWGFWGYDAARTFAPHPELYVRWYEFISDPYTWGSLEDKSLMLHDSTNTISAYVGSSRNQLLSVPSSGPGMPFVANYRDLDWMDTSGQYTKVNRFQNQGQNITLQPGKWYLFEWYIRLNTPGVSDGVTKLWIDDATEEVATQTLRMHYTDMMWLRSGDGGKLFDTLRLTVYNQRCDGTVNTCPPNGPAMLNQSHRWDRIVVSKSPVGPVPSPTVAVASPRHNAVVAGTIPVIATSTYPEIVGVQFQLDGAPLGPEDTSAPYSVAWDTATVADGPHRVTALARDAAGDLNPSGGVTVAVANARSVTRVEEASASVTYMSPTSWIHGNAQRMWSGATAALGFASGQRVTFTFSGTGVSWIGFRGPQTSIANVHLDGNLVAVVDAYSPTEELDARLFTASGLTPELHTLTITVPSPRAKNPLSTDYFTVVDAFDVIGPQAGIVPDSGSAIRLEQTSALVTYTGGWVPGNTARTWSGGTASLGFAEGQRATVHFVGTGVSWVGFRGPQVGLANVYLDGRLVATVDAYSAAEEAQAVLFTVTDLASGPHALTIEATGTKNPSSTDRFVVVDAFDVTWASTTGAS